METAENKLNFFRFEDLRIYEKSIEYIRWVYSVNTKIAPEHRILFETFLQSAHTIAINIAEGASRNKTQFVYYLKISKAAVNECVIYTEVAGRIGLLSEMQKEYSRTQLMEMTKMLGSLITSLVGPIRKPEIETPSYLEFPD
jgi:four helix bundle protein